MKVKELVDMKGKYSAHDVGECDITINNFIEAAIVLKTMNLERNKRILLTLILFDFSSQKLHRIEQIINE